jgi:hypothetical protein
MRGGVSCIFFLALFLRVGHCTEVLLLGGFLVSTLLLNVSLREIVRGTRKFV